MGVCEHVCTHPQKTHCVAAAVVTSQALTHLLPQVFDETGAFIALTCTSEGQTVHPPAGGCFAVNGLKGFEPLC